MTTRVWRSQSAVQLCSKDQNNRNVIAFPARAFLNGSPWGSPFLNIIFVPSAASAWTCRPKWSRWFPRLLLCSCKSKSMTTTRRHIAWTTLTGQRKRWTVSDAEPLPSDLDDCECSETTILCIKSLERLRTTENRCRRSWVVWWNEIWRWLCPRHENSSFTERRSVASPSPSTYSKNL